MDESETKKLSQEYYQLQEELNSFNAEDTTDIEKIEVGTRMLNRIATMYGQ